MIIQSIEIYRLLQIIHQLEGQGADIQSKVEELE
jgi:hypothetical protein